MFSIEIKDRLTVGLEEGKLVINDNEHQVLATSCLINTYDNVRVVRNALGGIVLEVNNRKLVLELLSDTVLLLKVAHGGRILKNLKVCLDGEILLKTLLEKAMIDILGITQTKVNVKKEKRV